MAAVGSREAMRWSGGLLVAVAWASGAIFGAYILAFYAGAAFDRALPRWNQTLNDLYGPNTPFATVGIGLHFIAGGALLLLGPIQLLQAVRERFRAFHRVTGRIYAAAALLAGFGGLAFIAQRGTIGGWPMSLLFGLYGVMMIVASLQTVRLAMLKRFARHRAWALRLFALATGSWLYRIEYGAWFLAVGRAGHTASFTGWFDYVMDGFFYLPNLLLVEAWLRASRTTVQPAARIAIAAALLAATAFILLATWFFTTHYWGAPILDRLPRLPF